MKRFFVSLLSAVVIFAGLGVAGVQAQSLFGPSVPKAVGAPHPEGNEFWRINHMSLLSHDRDETMRLGDRNISASLKECVACHAVDDAAEEPVGYESEEFFCRVCHDYVAVKIDCFTCHQSKPDSGVLAELLEGAPTIVSSISIVDATGDLERYLTSVGHLEPTALTIPSTGEASQ
ncbi:MAG: hypothetical protein L3J13_07685 [Devosiaceae bacterium]|nr:hypothetical protein [Devosiaceae bacterium]